MLQDGTTSPRGPGFESQRPDNQDVIARAEHFRLKQSHRICEAFCGCVNGGNMPDFAPPNFSIEAVGESHYQKNIKKIVMFKELVDEDDLEYKDASLIATLILEDDNSFDPGNAVRVDIEGLTVGYLDKEDARNYRRSLAKLDLPVKPYTCKAVAYGKREELDAPMRFGIWLYLAPRDLQIFIPPPRKKLFGIF